MKVLFAGPSLYRTIWSEDLPAIKSGVCCRGPAGHGDITEAVLQGATLIGLVDGLFEHVAAVWHKEILYALQQGVRILGAASMGALRAAECADFGMIGIGRVYEMYRTGEIEDDAAVAVCHGPAELGYIPVTEALVNVAATVQHLTKLGLVDEGEAALLQTRAKQLFFKERTYAEVVSLPELGRARQEEILRLIRLNKVDLKQRDALLLAQQLCAERDARNYQPPSWEMQVTSTWLEALDRAHEKITIGSAFTSEFQAQLQRLTHTVHHGSGA